MEVPMLLVLLLACGVGHVATDGCDCEEGGKIIPGETGTGETAADTSHTGDTMDTSAQQATSTTTRTTTTCPCLWPDSYECVVNVGEPGVGVVDVMVWGHQNPAWEGYDAGVAAWRAYHPEALDVASDGSAVISCAPWGVADAVLVDGVGVYEWDEIRVTVTRTVTE